MRRRRTGEVPYDKRLVDEGAPTRLKAQRKDCLACPQCMRCLRRPESNAARKAVHSHERQLERDDPCQRMRCAIDAPRGRTLCNRRIATVGLVLSNICHVKQLNRFTLCGRMIVGT